MAKYLKILILSFVLLFLCTANAEAKVTSAKKVIKPKPVTKEYVRLFYCQNGKKARDSFAKNYRSIDVLAPQAYSVTATGTLIGGIDKQMLATARRHNVKLMPLVVNKNFSSEVSASFLGNLDYQKAAIKAMVDEAVKENYWGWQVDFEQINISYRDQFTNFVKMLDDELEKVDKVSSVAVIAQTSTNPGDYKSDYWNKFIGVYDYKGLASSTDFISLMSYDDPGSTGPVTRYSWLLQVLDYATKNIPAEKISVGVPLYYWRWNETTGKRVATGGYSQLLSQMQRHYIKYGYSNAEHTAYASYTSNKMKYKIWYENGASIQKKIDLIKKYGLHGFSAWALGLEVPSIYNALFKNTYQL